MDPRSVVPESVMPPYAFLAQQDLDASHMDEHLRVNRMLRVPYTQDQIEHANADAVAQATPDSEGASDFSRRYPNAAVRDFDGDPTRVTKMDALIAYLQMLGAGVDFSTYHADAPENQR
jgi:cytochrome c oxidase cbb3-type subunit 2